MKTHRRKVRNGSLVAITVAMAALGPSSLPPAPTHPDDLAASAPAGSDRPAPPAATPETAPPPAAAPRPVAATTRAAKPAPPALVAARQPAAPAPAAPAGAWSQTPSTDHGGLPLTAPAPARGRQAVPRGFEEWFAPQKTAVDLYYGGRFLMTTLVEYTPEAVTFLNPAEVAARLPGLRAPAEMAVLLAASLPANGDKVCVRPNQPLCGRLEPATVGIVFDESRFRANLFLHPSLLSALPTPADRYLPEPVHDQPTLVQNLSLLYSGSRPGDDRYSLYGRTRVGHGRGHGFANWVSTDETPLSTDTLGYTYDFKDIQVSAGLIEPAIDALRAVPRQPLTGVSVARSLLTRTDLDSMLASPIDLFLPVRGRIDIFRDGRLVSTGFYEAGNQRIDTANLPAGAYTIDIVITDITGSTRNLQQLFIKSSLMAPPGEPLWFVDAGRVMQRDPLEAFPRDFGTAQLRAGYRWRHTPWLGAGAAAALTGNESLLELSAGVLFDRLEGSAEVYGSSAGGSGFGLRGLGRWRRLVASANLQETRANDPLPAGDDSYQLLPTAQSLRALYLTHPFWQGLASASTVRRSGGAGDRSQRTTVGYSRTFPLGGQHSLQAQAEVGDEDGDALAMLTLQWRNLRGQWSDSARLRLQRTRAGDNADEVSAGVATTWRDGDRFEDDVEVSLRAEAGERNRSVTVDGEHRSQFGRGTASLTTAESSGADQRLASVGYNTSFVIGQGGTLAWGGGPNLYEAGVLLDLRDTPEALLEISADGQPQFVARGGGTAALTLPPYQQYRLRLRDRGLALTQVDEEAREVTLYPGHVVNLDWRLQSVQVLLARIVTPDGQALANARVNGAEGIALTDAEGFVQTEVRRDVPELVVRVNGHACRVALPAALRRESVMRAGRLVCETAGEP